MLKRFSITSGALALTLLSTGAFARDDGRAMTFVAPVDAPLPGTYSGQPAKSPGNNRYAPYAASRADGQVYASGYYSSAAKREAPHNRYAD